MEETKREDGAGLSGSGVQRGVRPPLVERLRAPWHHADAREAADEIELLREALAKANDQARALRELKHWARRALAAWDCTVLPKTHDGMMQERMEDLLAWWRAAGPDHATPSGGQEAGPEEDRIEAAYWRFDARHKGYGQWKPAPVCSALTGCKPDSAPASCKWAPTGRFARGALELEMPVPSLHRRQSNTSRHWAGACSFGCGADSSQNWTAVNNDKRKPGRPALPPGEKLVVVPVRLTEAQKAKLQRIGVQRLRDWLDRAKED